jgi:hypothetical protein
LDEIAEKFIIENTSSVESSIALLAKGFFDHILRSHESYSAKWDYVRQNPVRARLVKEWSEWPFVGEMFDLEFRNDRV